MSFVRFSTITQEVLKRTHLLRSCGSFLPCGVQLVRLTMSLQRWTEVTTRHTFSDTLTNVVTIRLRAGKNQALRLLEERRRRLRIGLSHRGQLIMKFTYRLPTSLHIASAQPKLPNRPWATPE